MKRKIACASLFERKFLIRIPRFKIKVSHNFQQFLLFWRKSKSTLFCQKDKPVSKWRRTFFAEDKIRLQHFFQSQVPEKKGIGIIPFFKKMTCNFPIILC